MNTTPAFEHASWPMYNAALFSAPEDKACISVLENLARLLPAKPTDNIIPEQVHILADRMASLAPTNAMGEDFAVAYKTLAETVKGLCYLDGNKNHCLRMNTYDALLEGFQLFHGKQDSLKLSCVGSTHFTDRIRTRQVYWDVGGNLAPTTYQPSNYR